MGESVAINSKLTLKVKLGVKGSDVAQLEEQLLPTPEVQGLNLVIGILLSRRFVYCQLKRKEESKEKEAGNGPFLLKKTRQWTSRKN